eukprot:2947898-Rhodomonas_salina.1
MRASAHASEVAPHPLLSQVVRMARQKPSRRPGVKQKCFLVHVPLHRCTSSGTPSHKSSATPAHGQVEDPEPFLDASSTVSSTGH